MLRDGDMYILLGDFILWNITSVVMKWPITHQAVWHSLLPEQVIILNNESTVTQSVSEHMHTIKV
jgi:hypothetical protein